MSWQMESLLRLSSGLDGVGSSVPMGRHDLFSEGSIEVNCSRVFFGWQVFALRAAEAMA